MRLSPRMILRTTFGFLVAFSMFRISFAKFAKTPGLIQTKKKKFTITDEEIESFVPSTIPLTITELNNSIANLAKTPNIKRIPNRVLSSWLVKNGFLEHRESNGKNTKYPTSLGEEIGIYAEEKIGSYGPYLLVVYTDQAQQFIVDHLKFILEEYDSSEYMTNNPASFIKLPKQNNRKNSFVNASRSSRGHKCF